MCLTLPEVANGYVGEWFNPVSNERVKFGPFSKMQWTRVHCPWNKDMGVLKVVVGPSSTTRVNPLI